MILEQATSCSFLVNAPVVGPIQPTTNATKTLTTHRSMCYEAQCVCRLNHSAAHGGRVGKLSLLSSTTRNVYFLVTLSKMTN